MKRHKFFRDQRFEPKNYARSLTGAHKLKALKNFRKSQQQTDLNLAS